MKTITIHQPGYLPWLGFFDKMARSDVFVFLDDAQYERNYFDNRNKIKTAQGWTWLTVPVTVSLGEKLNEVLIDNKHSWRDKHWKTILMNYGKTPYFKQYAEYLESIYSKEWVQLIDLNLELIRFIAAELGIKSEFILSSTLTTVGAKGDRLLDICQKLSADVYLSGQFGRNYLDEKIFEEKNIKVIYQYFHHPVYPQRYGEFLPAMAAIDLLFNCGPDSLKILLAQK